MIPEPSQALKIIMGTLMMDIAPNVTEEYRRANVNLLGFVAMLIAEEYDRAAEVRCVENREMRTLFGRFATVVERAELRARLTVAANGADPDLRVSQLTATNNDLRRLLIELHACIEEQGTPEAVEVARAIWGFLRDASQRRAIQIG